MPSCALKLCHNNGNNNKALSFFMFPKEKQRFQVWIKRCGQPDLQHNKNMRICDEHFKKEDIEIPESPNGRKRLKTTALPTIKIKTFPPTFQTNEPQLIWLDNRSSLESISDGRVVSDWVTFKISEPEPFHEQERLTVDDESCHVVSISSFPDETIQLDIQSNVNSSRAAVSKFATGPQFHEGYASDFHRKESSCSNDKDGPKGLIPQDIEKEKRKWIEDGNEHCLRESPRKRKLRTTLKNKRSLISKLKRKVECKSVISKTDVLNYCKGKLSVPAYNLLAMQFKSGKKTAYTPKEKLLALTLYYAGPSAYRLLRSIIKLPSISSLTRWLKGLIVQPGLCPDIFKVLKSKVSQMNDLDKVCVLYMDEMSIKEGLNYHANTDKIYGFVDYGRTSRESLQAKISLVLMLRGIHSNWKQPVSFVFSNKAVTSEKLRPFFFQCLLAIKNCGLKVVGVVTDQGSNFIRFFKDLNVTVESPFFQFEDSKIFVFADVPHLLKSTRNALKKNNIITSEGTVEWKYIRKCFECKQEMNFPFIPKITEKHINVPAFGYAMKVKPAAQVLSNSMSTAISMLMFFGNIDETASATSEFCKKINNLFDILNASQRNSASPYKKGLTLGSVGWNYLEEVRTWLVQWRVINGEKGDVTNTYKFIKGWILTINSTLQLHRYLVETFKWEYLLTRRMCQDGLENLFGTIRRKGGFRENPTCLQFCDTFKSVCVETFLTPPKSSNCLKDEGQFLLEFAHLQTEKTVKKTTLLNDFLTTKDVNLESNLLTVETSLYHEKMFLKTKAGDILERNGMFYVAGYLAKRLFDHHKTCTDCDNLNVSEKNFNGEDAVFLMLKSFSSDPQIGLYQPSEFFFAYIEKCEEMFGNVFDNIYLCEGLHFALQRQLFKVGGFKFCNNKIKTYFIKLFVRMRINFILKFKNIQLSIEASKRKTDNNKNNTGEKNSVNPSKLVVSDSRKTKRKLKKLQHL